jgi:predicted aminopeptidase
LPRPASATIDEGVKVVRALLLLSWPLLACACTSTVGYLAKQGRYLLRDSRGTRSAKALLASASTDEGTRAFLLQAEDIRRYAFQRMGLKENRNYTRYKELGRDRLVSVVSACAADSFTPYSWRYPLLGRLPYRGYYEPADAQAEAARLKAEGWDVIVRPVDSFSTLGLTRDPLYSFMKGYSAFELASLILHEQTHATLFVKGQTQFSEELATLVGEEGALAWLAERRGPDSIEHRQALDQLADGEVFVALLRGLAGALDQVYRSALSREEKLERKARIIADFQADFASGQAARFRTEGFRAMAVPQVNNAYLALSSLYTDDVPLLRAYWRERCGGDLRRLLADARALARRGDVKQQMRAALAGP